jgi:hypothetical protein
MARPDRCPNCGEHVSHFAAGCAICGTALDPKRGQHQSAGQRAASALRGLPRIRLGIPLKRG